MILIPQNILTNSEFTDCEVCTYAFLRYLTISEESDSYIVTAPMITHQMFDIRCIKNNGVNIDVGEALQSLHDRNICGLQKFKNGTYIIPAFKMSEKDKPFIKLSLSNVQKLLRNVPQRPYTLFRYYALLLQSRNNSLEWNMQVGKIGNMNRQYFSNILGTSLQTISSYTKVLMDLELIYNFSYSGSGANIYGAYEDRKLIESYVKNLNKPELLYNNRVMNGRLARLLSPKKLSHRDYSREELIELYNFAVDHNKHELELKEKYPEYHSKKIWDLEKLKELTK